MPIHSLDHAQPYDYVLYGASVAGVLLALHHAAAGASVLLLNPYGFPGGTLTESLSCLQTWPVSHGPHARQLFGQLAADRYATVYDGPEGRVLNPEVVKIALQRALEASPVHLLFHVKARGLAPATTDGLHTLRLVGKEGEFRVQGRHLLDTSDAGHLGRTLRGGGELAAARLCVFTSPASAAAAAILEGWPQLQQAVRLPDGRYWLALNLPAAEAAFVEQQANDVLDALTAALTPHGTRLQIVPAETQLLYAPAPTPVATVADLLPERAYAPQHWLQRAADAEAAAIRTPAPLLR